MSRKLLLLMLLALLIGTFNLASKVEKVEAIGTIYIRADGSIDPPAAPISTVDNITYTFTGNVISNADGIIVERNNIVIDGAGYTVQGTGLIYSIGIDLTGISNVTIKNTEITTFYVGIMLGDSSNISGNNITDNGYGIDIFLTSGHNSISGNNITANNEYGIWVSHSSANSISGNNITNNTCGIYLHLYMTVYNSVFHNNIVNNTIQAQDYTPLTTWDDGYPSGGNYWSNNNGTDVFSGLYQNETGSDGIGDTPYVDGYTGDNYPLMNPWFHIFGDINYDSRVNLQDLVLLANAYGSRPDEAKWNPNADINGNGIVDLTDLVILAIHYGQHNP